MQKLKLLLSFIFILSCGVILSQDTIYKSNGDIIVAKISEISPTEIKFKRYDMPDGPAYIELRSNIIKINYFNGTTDNFKKVVIADDYVSKEVESSKIEFNGRRYMYKGESYNEKRIQTVLIDTQDPQIMDLVRRAKRAKKLQFLGFLGIPFGAVAVVSSYVALVTYDEYSTNNELSTSAMEVAAVAAVVAIASPMVAVSFKMRRKDLNAKAVKLHNEKYP